MNEWKSQQSKKSKIQSSKEHQGTLGASWAIFKPSTTQRQTAPVTAELEDISKDVHGRCIVQFIVNHEFGLVEFKSKHINFYAVPLPLQEDDEDMTVEESETASNEARGLMTLMVRDLSLEEISNSQLLSYFRIKTRGVKWPNTHYDSPYTEAELFEEACRRMTK